MRMRKSAYTANFVRKDAYVDELRAAKRPVPAQRPAMMLPPFFDIYLNAGRSFV
jgi:hypothetical protein